MLKNFKAIFMSDLAIFEMLFSNADLTDSLRENADKNRFFYCIFCHAQRPDCHAERPDPETSGREKHLRTNNPTKFKNLFRPIKKNHTNLKRFLVSSQS